MLQNHCRWSRRCFAARHILTASCLLAAMVFGRPLAGVPVSHRGTPAHRAHAL